jgi:hypothetical protein
MSERPTQLIPLEDLQLEWIERFPIVRQTFDRGFYPWAYGPWGEKVNPTKFYWPQGGMEHPHHVSPTQGCRFVVYSQWNEIPLAKLQWLEKWNVSSGLYFRACHGLTLEDALTKCLEMASEHVQTFVEPVWVFEDDRWPSLPRDQWLEVADSVRQLARPQPAQLNLFETPQPDPYDQAADSIRAAVADCPGDAWITLRFPYGLLLNVEYGLGHLNRLRQRAERELQVPA